MEAQWYFTNQKQRFGPVSSERLKHLASSGRLQPSDLVWKEGMAQWVAASQVTGLFPPTSPPVAKAHSYRQSNPRGLPLAKRSRPQKAARAEPGSSARPRCVSPADTFAAAHHFLVAHFRRVVERVGLPNDADI